MITKLLNQTKNISFCLRYFAGANKSSNLYQILGIPKTADLAEIKQAYRDKAMKEHPDKGGDPEKFKEVTEAYQILSNPQKRQLYDKYGKEGIDRGDAPNMDPFDIFNNIFGMGRRPQTKSKPRPRKVVVKVPLKTIYCGGIQEICVKCQGKGGINPSTCTTCQGKKIINKIINLGPGMFTQTAASCHSCDGMGVVFGSGKCSPCYGKGVVQKNKVINLVIDPGVPEGHNYVFAKQGDQSLDTQFGDVVFSIQIEQDKHFVRNGSNLHYKKKITLVEALTSLIFEVAMPDGNKISIANPASKIIEDKNKRIIKGKGLPIFKDPLKFKGDLVIEFSIQYPKSVNPKDYAELARILQQPNPKRDFPKNVQYLEDYEEKQQQNTDERKQGVKCQQQ